MDLPIHLVVILIFFGIVMLSIAFLPEIIALIAGQRGKDIRLIGMLMFVFKKRGGYNNRVIMVFVISSWAYAGLSLIDLFAGKMEMGFFYAVAAFCFQRHARNWELGNMLLGKFHGVVK